LSAWIGDWQGVLRQVPLVGSLINWWSPPPKDPIKGRTFNLTSGKLKKIYFGTLPVATDVARSMVCVFVNRSVGHNHNLGKNG